MFYLKFWLCPTTQSSFDPCPLSVFRTQVDCFVLVCHVYEDISCVRTILQVAVHSEVDTVVPAVDVYSDFVDTNPSREDNLFRPYVITSISVRLDRHLTGLAYFLIMYVHMDLNIVDAVLVLNLVLHDESTRVSRREGGDILSRECKDE